MTLEELGHPQPKTQVQCDNATAVGIANNTVKRQQFQWRCGTLGCVIKLHKKQMMSDGTQVKKTWLINRANTT
jgi:hypothetical protein